MLGQGSPVTERKERTELTERWLGELEGVEG